MSYYYRFMTYENSIFARKGILGRFYRVLEGCCKSEKQGIIANYISTCQLPLFRKSVMPFFYTLYLGNLLFFQEW